MTDGEDHNSTFSDYTFGLEWTQNTYNEDEALPSLPALDFLGKLETLTVDLHGYHKCSYLCSLGYRTS